MKLSSLTIFFPFFNDAPTVDKLVTQAYFFGKQVTEDLEVIAIHGGASKDRTMEEILKARRKHPDLVVLDHTSNQEGYGVIRHGFQAATKEWVFYTDGDAQYHLKDLLKLTEKVSVDVINGYKIRRSDPWLRIVLGKGYQLFSRFLFRLPVRDIDCDFRLIRRKYLQNIVFMSRGASILPELLLHLQRAGARFAEVPIQHYPRLHGQSNYTPFGLLFEKLQGDLKLFFAWKASVFQAMRQVEERHWWYVALREQIYEEVKKIPDPLICDVGCGTGCNMQFLKEKKYNIQGVDLSAEALHHCLERGLTEVQKGSITDLPFRQNSFDLVLLIDVLCMLESEEIPRAVEELRRILKPGGTLILNEPAFRQLRSQHDLNCLMKNRFSQRECISLLTHHGFEIQQSSYRVCFLFPVIALIKIINRCLLKLTIPIAPLNWLLLLIQRGEHALMKRGYKMPFGSSVFIVARRLRVDWPTL